MELKGISEDFFYEILEGTSQEISEEAHAVISDGIRCAFWEFQGLLEEFQSVSRGFNRVQQLLMRFSLNSWKFQDISKYLR